MTTSMTEGLLPPQTVTCFPLSSSYLTEASENNDVASANLYLSSSYPSQLHFPEAVYKNKEAYYEKKKTIILVIWKS